MRRRTATTMMTTMITMMTMVVVLVVVVVMMMVVVIMMKVILTMVVVEDDNEEEDHDNKAIVAAMVAAVISSPPSPYSQDWWNAREFEQYWRLWNIPVHNFIVRHCYFPLLRHISTNKSLVGALCFTLSALLHEAVVALPLRTYRCLALPTSEPTGALFYLPVRSYMDLALPFEKLPILRTTYF
ncbi:MAG: hypothetical protein SGPRY_002337 [Prymnesium sp.]